jgi:SnoaL-like polyketide cyclase
VFPPDPIARPCPSAGEVRIQFPVSTPCFEMKTGVFMFNDQNKVIARRLIEEGFNKNNLKLANEILTPDAQIHDTQFPVVVGKGPEGLKLSMQPYLNAFPDVKLTIEREIVDGDYVVQYVRSTGTHTAPLAGIPRRTRRSTSPASSPASSRTRRSSRPGRSSTSSA